MKAILDGYIIDLKSIYAISPIEFNDEWRGYEFNIRFLNRKTMSIHEGISLSDSVKKEEALSTITKLRDNLVKVWNDNKPDLIEITVKLNYENKTF